MKGSRPLSDAEVRQVVQSFQGSNALRDRALFVLGVKTGLRISELLSITVGDVLQHGRIADRITIRRRHMKRKVEGRTVLLDPEVKAEFAAWIARLQETAPVSSLTPVFLSRKGSDRAIGRKHAWQILTTNYAGSNLPGTLGTHAMRKTFANRAHQLLGRDLVKSQRAVGHRNVNSTVAYLSFREEIDKAILAL